MERAVILEGARTPIGKFLGGFAETPAVELGIAATREALRRAGVDAEVVQELVYGHARQAGNGPNTGRQVSYRSGIPQEVSAFNVNMACASGTKAIQLASEQIALGNAEVTVAGGMENMSRVPFLLDRMRTGYRLGDASVIDAMYRDGFLDPLCGLLMGETAENLARRYDISREEQDEFALASQHKAEAQKERRAAEMFPVEVKGKDGETITVSEDEHPRADSTMEGLAKLKPVFEENGTVTAGNAAGITDGAASLVLMSESRAKAEGRNPLARVVATSAVGVDPAYMGIGVVPAVRKVLDKTGLSLSDFDVIDINEAFAAQVIACDRELKFDPDRLNVKGGSIAIGHPIGMSGVRIVLTNAYEMRERGYSLGLAALCVSGGQGMAVVLERG
ncbi:MAG: acetyl-CoA C-acetyltransferase [Actinomycetota bacterium]|nr:acetyl-CoA C-acetyltransferase [Actinomycetota bacterium]